MTGTLGLVLIGIISGGTAAAVVASLIRHMPPDWRTRKPVTTTEQKKKDQGREESEASQSTRVIRIQAVMILLLVVQGIFIAANPGTALGSDVWLYIALFVAQGLYALVLGLAFWFPRRGTARQSGEDQR